MNKNKLPGPVKRILVVYLFLSSSHLYGQVSDDFSDGDFTNNPVWNGNAAKFVITDGQLNSLNTGSATYYLSTPSSLATVAEWEFFINLKFGTSGANFVDIYLMSDQADLNATLNGYFVRMGNIDDEISLYKIVAGTETIIIDGLDDRVSSSSSNPFNIRVRRNDADIWTLEVDGAATNGYVMEGSTTDNGVNASTHFGLKIKQSSAASPINNHFFDNILVRTIVPDTKAPTIGSISVISNTEIDVKFDELVDQTTAEASINYIVNNEIGQPILVVLDGLDNSLVHLTFANSFLNESYQIAIQNVKDINGNAITTEVEDFEVLIPELAATGDIVINEIMADPTPEVGLPNSEFIEIYNRSNKFIDLANYTLSDKVITTGTEIIAPDQYIILCEMDNATLLQSFGTVIGLSSWNTLTNGGEKVTLYDVGQDLIVDEVTYVKDWHNNEDKEEGGWSLERINPDHQCSDEDNWLSSIDVFGGTPGTQNSVFDNTPDLAGPMLLSAILLSTDSLKVIFDERLDTVSFASAIFAFDPIVAVDTVYVESDLKTAIVVFSEHLQTSINYAVSVSSLSDCSGNVVENDQSTSFLLTSSAERNDIIISEIMADPTPAVGLPNSEYVELYNRSGMYFDLVNFTLNDEVVVSTNYILAPTEYVLLVPDSEVSLYSDVNYVIGLNSWDALTNSGEHIKLKNGSGLVIDQLTFSNNWHTDPEKDDGGWSLERINPDHQCGDEGNWSSSNDALGGTPGNQNSAFDNTPDLTGPLLLSAISLSTDSLKLIFDERLDTVNFAPTIFTFDPDVLVDTSYIQPDLKTVVIVFAEHLQTSINYTISVTGLSDCSGNVIEDNQSATFLLTSLGESNDIIISEIMADPSPEVGLPETEYVEIYNRSNKYIDLANYTLDEEVITLESRIIAPNEYIILCDNDDEYFLEDFGEVIGINSWNSLTNAGNTISLVNSAGHLIDQVSYKDSWYNSIDRSDGGWSLELIDPENLCGEENNWSASINDNGGTPGEVNSVNGNKPDRTGPSLLTAIAIASDSLILKFDERIDTTSFPATSYTFEPSLNVDHAILGSDFREITIVFSDPIPPSIVHQIMLDQLRDCNGNLIGENDTQIFALSEVAEQGDVLINELLYNPITSGGDFVEVYNNSAKYINLKDWMIANGDDELPENAKIISDNHLLISPQQYLVLSQNPLAVASDYPKGKLENFVEVQSLPSFPNDGQGVVVLNPEAIAFDYFPYDDDMQHALLDDDKGVSLERISFDNPASDRSNWHSAANSVGFATPGYVNSQVINGVNSTSDDIRISPQIFLPNQSGQNDFTTINYSFNQSGFIATVSILDVTGRVVIRIAQNELLATTGFFQWDGTMDNGQKASSGAYIVLFEVFDLSGTQKKYKKRVVIAPEL